LASFYLQIICSGDFFVADTKSTTTNSPRFSAGLVTTIVTVAWLIVFGVAMVYGIGGIEQHDGIVSTQAAE